ncbi:MAG: response regulator [Fimbriimonas sp.]|nr:response regulator [Fimbriimonas sp.]
MKVLIVDDNRTNLKLLRAILEDDGHDVVEANDGAQALVALELAGADAIITDILMPKVDGYRLCYEVRRHERHRSVPLIVYTATYTSPADEKLCMDLGADRYLRKPVSNSALLAALRETAESPSRLAVVTLSSSDVLKEYSERLVNKLEETNQLLQRQSAELAEANLQLRQLLAHSPAVLYSIQIEDGILVPTLVSDNIERLLGISAQMATYDWWVSSLHPEDREEVLAIKNRALAGAGSTHEYRLRHTDGSYRWVEDSNRVALDDDGTPLRIVGVWMDITDRKDAEEQLQQVFDRLESRVRERTAELGLANEQLLVAKEIAEEANRSKSDFLSRMSHELRTPMNSILGFGQLLEFTDLDTNQRDSVDHILRAGRHLLKLINEVLEICRIDAGALTVSLEPISVAELIEETVALMEPAAKERGIRLEVAGDLSIYVLADHHRLRQVMLNLVSNAIKYNKENGKVTVRASVYGSGIGYIEIEDTGIGIEDTMMHRLFTPFDRMAAEMTAIEGTGLGLALSKSLMDAMDGVMTVQTQAGVGTTFKLGLSLCQPALALDSAQVATRELAAPRPNLVGLVLAIEDNPTNLKLLARVLERYPDIKLITAMQGRQGLDLARHFMPNVILLDLHLPDMHGRDVLLELQGNPKLMHVPVIVLTADAFSDHWDSIVKTHSYRFLTKPFVLDELLDAIAGALQGGHSA